MKILFIGNRFHVLEVILEKNNIDIDIYALRDSLLVEILQRKELSFKMFDLSDKKSLLQTINDGEYDALISNGCPFIIPINELISKKLLINIHPTVLPQLRGKTPLNGVFYNNIPFLGATMHYISNEIDGGNIIYQEKIKITEDIDQGLVYYISFLMEGLVFRKGWTLLKENNFILEGDSQTKREGFYFNRTPDKMIVDFFTMNSAEILKRIKSFGVLHQGCKTVNIKSGEINYIYEAQVVINPFLLELFKFNKTGNVLLKYDNKCLVKTMDGIIKIIHYE